MIIVEQWFTDLRASLNKQMPLSIFNISGTRICIRKFDMAIRPRADNQR